MKKLILILTMILTAGTSLAFADTIKCVKETYTYKFDEDEESFTNVFYVIGNFVIFDLKWGWSKYDKLLFYKGEYYYYNDEGYPTYLGDGELSEIVYGTGEHLPHIIGKKKEETFFDKSEFYYLLVDNFYDVFLNDSGNNQENSLWRLQKFIDRIGIYTKSDLRFLRNAIYAKYGYGFKSEDLIEVFTKCDWYDASKNYSDWYVENEMSKNDKSYLKLIQLLEK